MKYTAIDWFYGVCYGPEQMRALRMANPDISDTNLQAVFSVLPRLSDEELSDVSSPSHRVVDVDLDKTSTYSDMWLDYLDRPLDLSVACFAKEVLSRYDVRVRDSLVHCDWALRDVYVNRAGQVHVCICDLSDLPDDEQEHWKSYNEAPDVQRDRGEAPPPFHGMARRFVERCLFNMCPE